MGIVGTIKHSNGSSPFGSSFVDQSQHIPNSCLIEYGCQNGCVNSSELSATKTVTSTSSSLPSSTIIKTVTSTPSSSPSSTLTKDQLISAVVGPIIAFIVISIALLWCYKRFNHLQPNLIFRREENGTTQTLELPHLYADRNPDLVNRAALLLGGGNITVTGGTGNIKALPPGRRTRPESGDGYFGNDPVI
ncbi:hypothetical protein FGG08_005071 [Glutinoglossum americanum]|uniref:Uncharacterized protein n=1 Tax=Glutinoglossum americanum TaxID=1670608 RepID=A0A9P8L1T6_9PEZI|nr:hypothetical protein FGG08_005071 [Glutinoglossum americanum]